MYVYDITHVCMYVSMYLCIYVSMYVCMYLCMYVCMFVPTYIRTYVQKSLDQICPVSAAPEHDPRAHRGSWLDPSINLALSTWSTESTDFQILLRSP